MSNSNIYIDYDEDRSKKGTLKIGFVSILIIIILNIATVFLFFTTISSGNFNSLLILINSSLGVIIGFVLYDLGNIFESKKGRIAGISKVIFDIVLILFSLFYNDYLINLDNSFTTIIVFPGLDVEIKIAFLLVYYSSVSPFWFQIIYFIINLLLFIEVALISNFMYILGRNRNLELLKRISILYLLSYVLLIIFYYIPFILIYLSSIILENLLLLIFFHQLFELKIAFEIDSIYKPVHEEYK